MGVKETLIEFFRKEIINGQNINLLEEVDLIEQGIIDSLAIMKIITFLEDRYSINISDTELMPENFENINSLVAMVDEKKTIPTNGGAHIEGDVQARPDFVGCDKIESLIQHLEQKTANRDL